MSDAMQAGWDAAVAACLNGHDDCSYGGMSPSGGYWIADSDCPLNHGGTCAWCVADATTGLAGWAPDGWSIWGVPACREHADAWIAAHPDWGLDAEPPPRKTMAELLAEMDPITRVVAEEYNRAMEEALIGRVEPGDGPYQFDGLLATLGIDDSMSAAFVAPYPKAAPPGPPRLRFNQDTKTWEAT